MYIDEWLTIACAIASFIMLIYFLSSVYKKIYKIIYILLFITSSIWAIYSAYLFPYWNSRAFLAIQGKEYTQTTTPSRLISSNEALADLAFCTKTLLKAHPQCRDSFPMETNIKFKQAHNKITEKDSISIIDLYILLQSACASLNDAHTKVCLTNHSNKYADYYQCDEILSINGNTYHQIVDSTSHLISSETTKWTEYLINNRLRSYEGLLSLGYNPNKGIEVTYRIDSSIVTKKYSGKDYNTINFNKHSLSSERIGFYSLPDSNSIAYLKLENCYYYTLLQRYNFNTGLKNMFSEIKSRSIDNLILDLRGNPGGNMAIIYEFFKYLPVQKYDIPVASYRRGPLLIKMKSHKINSQYKKYIYEGNIYVLTSLSTFSGGMHFADCLQGNNLATIIGESPANAATCYSNIAPYILPNSKLSLHVSTTRYNRVNPKDSNAFIKPDIECKAINAYEISLKVIDSNLNK